MCVRMCLNRSKAKNAQEAHEAIRPTDSDLLPEALQLPPSSPLLYLYNLIWSRAVASQMASAKLLQACSPPLGHLLPEILLRLSARNS